MSMAVELRKVFDEYARYQNLVHIRDLSIQTSAGADQTSSSSTELVKLAEHLNQLGETLRILITAFSSEFVILYPPSQAGFFSPD